MCPPKGADAVRQMQLIRRRVEAYGFDYAGGFTTSARQALALALISFDRADPSQAAAVAGMSLDLVRDAAEQGFAPYRSHLALMDLIADRYGHDDHAARHVHETTKDALDPNGILSPGKQGRGR